MRESKVETYLKRRVKAKGGIIRKLKWVSCRNAPDDFVVLFRQVWLVECKAPSKKPRSGQDREHDRLRAAGVNVAVVSTFEEVDALLDVIDPRKVGRVHTPPAGTYGLPPEPVRGQLVDKTI